MTARPRRTLQTVLALAVLLVVGAALIGPKRKATEGRRAIAPAEQVRTTPHGLVLVSASDLRKRILRTKASGVLVNAWASWCESCKGEMPMLVRTGQTLAGRIDVVFVSVDDLDADGEAAVMLTRLGAPSPGLIVGEPIEAFKKAINPKWPGMLPATFLFDRAGKLRYYWGGPVDEEELMPLITRYLAGETIDGEADFALAPGAVTR